MIDPNTRSLEFGVDPHTIHRTNAPDTSIEAAHKVDTATDEERVFYYICNANNGEGQTLKEIANRMGKQNNQISGRITSLQKKRMIEDSGIRRDGCRVMKAGIRRNGCRAMQAVSP